MHIHTLLTAFLAATATATAIPSSLRKRAGRTSTPSGCLTVRPSPGSGEYATLTAALSKLGTSSTAAACIFMYSGTYTEQPVIQYKGALTLYGYTSDTGNWKNNKVLITHTINSATAGSLDASATVQVKSAGFKAYNINFKNGYGSGAQAVAVSANADKISFYGCAFYSYQDTLYTKAGRQYYSNCYVEGAVDYIFGDAAVWFGECTIASNGGGAITASSRETSSDPAWIVFDHSTITAASGVSIAGKVYLGRPWRVLARVIYQTCSLSNVVNAAGWTTMAAGATPLFYEYNNSGAGASTSSRLYLTSTSVSVSKSTLWSGDTSWYDTSY